MPEQKTYVNLNGVEVDFDQVPMIYEKVIEWVRANIDNYPDMKTVQIPYIDRHGRHHDIVFEVDDLIEREGGYAYSVEIPVGS